MIVDDDSMRNPNLRIADELCDGWWRRLIEHTTVLYTL